MLQVQNDLRKKSMAVIRPSLLAPGAGVPKPSDPGILRPSVAFSLADDADIVIPDFDIKCTGGEEYIGEGGEGPSVTPFGPCQEETVSRVKKSKNEVISPISDFDPDCEQFPYQIDSIVEKANGAKKSEDYAGGIDIYTHWLDVHILGKKAKAKGSCIHDKKSVAQIYNNRGHLKYLSVNFQGALEDYNQALSLDSRLASSYYNRGTIMYRMGDFKKALQDMMIANRLEPEVEDFQLALLRTTDQVIRMFGPIIPRVSLEQLKSRYKTSAISEPGVDEEEFEGETIPEEEPLLEEAFPAEEEEDLIFPASPPNSLKDEEEVAGEDDYPPIPVQPTKSRRKTKIQKQGKDGDAQRSKSIININRKKKPKK